MLLLFEEDEGLSGLEDVFEKFRDRFNEEWLRKWGVFMEITIKEWNENFGSDKDAEICDFAKSILMVLILLYLQKLLIMIVLNIY